MLVNLALGSVLISATVIIHTVGLIVLSRAMNNIVGWLRLHRHASGQATAMVAAVLGLFLIHTVEVWIWAIAYLALGSLQSLPDALYFSTVTFSTIGYGDVTLDPDWRLFASLEGMDGFLLIGWSTAYLVAASTRHGPFRLGEHF
jgi:hypothetical protein